MTATYQEELSRINDPEGAVDEAARRFGNPVELAQELGSDLRVFLLDALIAALAVVFLLSMTVATKQDLAAAADAFDFYTVIGLMLALGSLLLARFSGPNEIRDTHWALLDVEAA